MVKKRTRKKTVKKKSSQELLLENFIILQKKLAETTRELKETKLAFTELLGIFRRAESEFKQDKHISISPKIEEKIDQILKTTTAVAEGVVAVGETVKPGEEKEEKIVVEKDERPKKRPKRKAEEEEPEEDEEESEEDENYDLEPLPEFNF
ncbi:MAG: hypothetical protein JSW08_02120 [archaeon]|nr:MAG: hypothetical protein JSW08_02120 [archaeon]